MCCQAVEWMENLAACDIGALRLGLIEGVMCSWMATTLSIVPFKEA